MGKTQKKTGKGRLDKYYKLAKQVVLQKTFLSTNFFQGVDLVPIKPIPRVVTFASDITTPQCRNLIRGELKDWKADVVLHDGAPNVGTAWVQDAYGQSELVLMSLKLAVEFLVKGGTFVTKVFRSADYNNLIWVFNQLFGKVEATKPPSSRNVSAEIFVVCREFLAPKYIDPKFLDPKHVFKDLAASIPEGGEQSGPVINVQANVFHPEKNRRKREGYADGDYTLFRSVSASDFINAPDPISILGSYNKITFSTGEEKEWLSLDVTTEDVQANCEDLKVLGKGDFKTLMKWRLNLREELGLDVKTKDAEEITETVEVVEEQDEEEQIQDELERLNAENTARTKRDRRRANEKRTRTIQRMQLQMTAPLDIGLEQQDASLGFGQDDIFDLQGAEGARKRGRLSNQVGIDEDVEEDSDTGDEKEDSEEELDSDEERERRAQKLEAEMDGLYDAYQQRLREKDAKFKVKEARKKNSEREEWGGVKEDDDSEHEDGSDSEGGYDQMKRAEDSSSSDESDSDDDVAAKRKRSHPTEDRSRNVKRARLLTRLEEPKASGSQASKLWFSQDVFAGVDDDLENIEDDKIDSDIEMDDMDQDSRSEVEDDGDDFEIVPLGEDDTGELWDAENENEDEVKQEKIRQLGLVTPEAMTLAQQLVNREKTKTQLINDGFNRYSLNSKDDLPPWFLDDEAKHYKPNIPITKEAVAALRAKQRALDARPIKKIAEAKARKKYKAAQRLEKAMKKAEGVNATSDISEREKAQQIEKLMSKGMSSGKKKEVKVVVAKGAHRGIKGRPKGVKGRYTMVDARMKKEMRAKKRIEKTNKKRKHS
ncbi:AdoMet-dependent rRNA methyltransferase spb1 [Stygiomarasmius scandens]|uniref:AdoMet-dependent rRNA methyltransferase spb1 n=1 Tax=Marasmiellus scandens TaxID=2682957 RepID=A0ABR1JQL9_9AGAR